MNSTPVSPANWKQRYESLRAHFLEQPRLFGATPLGLITLMRDGLAAWMRRWVESTSSSGEAQRPATPDRTPTGVAPGTPLQLTLLLAQMTLSHLPSPATP
jgi:hypothetical protein